MKKIILGILTLILTVSLFGEGVIVTAEINFNDLSKGNDATIDVTYTFPEGTHQTLQEDLFYFTIVKPEGIEVGKINYPKGKEKDGVINYYEPATISAKANFPKNTKEITIEANYQICYDSGACLPPDYVEIKVPVVFLDSDTNNDIVLGEENETNDKGAEKKSIPEILKYLLFAFLGGLILNVMPCVLPVLSIKAMSIVKQSQQDKKQILLSSFAYTAGIIVSFLILAITVIILKKSGELVGWGFQFQSPGFVLALLGMIFVFSLSLFDVFIFTVPGMSTVTKASSKSGLGGSFLSGVFAVLLATPCTAPLLAPAIGFAFQQTAPMIVLMFLLIGIGLALPFILLGMCPAAIKLIPRPGEWMNIFKEFMGFLLLGTALYLLKTIYVLVGGENTIGILWYLLILALSAWIYGRWTRPHIPKIKQYIAFFIVAFLVVGGYKMTVNLDPPVSNAGGEVKMNSHKGWENFSPELVKKYREENIPVFIDFGAEWCMTCKTNETMVLYTDEIMSEFKRYGVKTVRGDYTRKDKTIGKWLRKYERAGVPLYLLFVPGENEAYVLPELISKSMVKELLEEQLGNR